MSIAGNYERNTAPLYEYCNRIYILFSSSSTIEYISYMNRQFLILISKVCSNKMFQFAFNLAQLLKQYLSTCNVIVLKVCSLLVIFYSTPFFSRKQNFFNNFIRNFHSYCRFIVYYQYQ